MSSFYVNKRKKSNYRRGGRKGRGLEVEEEADLCIGRRTVGTEKAREHQVIREIKVAGLLEAVFFHESSWLERVSRREATR